MFLIPMILWFFWFWKFWLRCFRLPSFCLRWRYAFYPFSTGSSDRRLEWDWAIISTTIDLILAIRFAISIFLHTVCDAISLIRLGFSSCLQFISAQFSSFLRVPFLAVSSCSRWANTLSMDLIRWHVWNLWDLDSFLFMLCNRIRFWTFSR